MVEKHLDQDQTQQTPELTEENTDKKPWFFKRVFKGIKEVPKFVGKVVKWVDKAISHIPIAGEVYGVAKWITREVWRASEQVPFLWEVTRGLREGAQSIRGTVDFTQPEKKQIAVAEDELIGSLRNIRNNLAQNFPEWDMKDDLIGFYDELLSRKDITPEEVQNLVNAITEKHPELKPVIQKMIDKIHIFKTGREDMAPDKIVEEWRQLEQKIIDIVNKEKESKKGWEIDRKDFTILKQTFPWLPDFDSLTKNSPLYNFLQNSYFSREPRPDIGDPLVKTFIEKTILIFQSSGESFSDALREKNDFVCNNKDKLITAFHLSDLETALLEARLNVQEKIQRLPPTLPHEYSGPDYGLYDARAAMFKKMFPDSSGQPREADQKLESYQGVLLDLFTGGGH
jgi:hypothetical protein